MKKTPHNIMATLGILAAITIGAGAAHAFNPNADRRSAFADNLADEACNMYLPDHAEYLKCYRTLVNTYKK